MKEFETQYRVESCQAESKKGLTRIQKIAIVVGMSGALVVPILACGGDQPDWQKDPNDPRNQIRARKTEQAHNENRGTDGALTGDQIRQAEKKALATADAKMYGSE